MRTTFLTLCLLLVAATASAQTTRRHWETSFCSFVFDTPDGFLHSGEWARSNSSPRKWVWNRTDRWGRGVWTEESPSFNTAGLTEVTTVGQACYDGIVEVTWATDIGRNEWAPSLLRPGRAWIRLGPNRPRTQRFMFLWPRIARHPLPPGLTEIAPPISEVLLLEETSIEHYQNRPGPPANTRRED